MSNALLAGPILRRTTQKSICVWLALDKKQELTLQILDNNTVIGASKPKDLKCSRVQLGSGLYVYLLQAYPTGNKDFFPTGKLYYYTVLDNQNQPLELKAAGLTYGDHPHPVFHIPEKLNSVLHGSCRKPHGAVGQDCLVVGDDLLEKTHNTISERPDLLLLTGDQIYADDVAAPLLKLLTDQAEKFMGRKETLPLSENGGHNVIPSAIPLGGRMQELKKYHSGLSSQESHNHLMGFGEYAAMYIYVFGNAQGWQLPGWEDIAEEHVSVKEGKQAVIKNATAAVADFAKNLPKVRRLLANIPTYMIFDDHDVTDDWNITGNWYDKVRTSPLGRRVVSNALAAYWAFQGWGNDPDNFDEDMIETIKIYVNHLNPDSDNDELYDLLTWKHRGWGFSVPTQPPIIAIDSRTQRQSDIPYYPARLLDRYALDWLRLEWSKLKVCDDKMQIVDEDTCPVLIATTPVLGFAPIEHFVRIGLWCVSYVEGLLLIRIVERLFNKKGFASEFIINFVDGEAWTTNLDGFTGFMDTVLHKMAIKRCVFLSGDVHYSFTARGRYTSKNNYSATQQYLHCYQLTSSSLRNEPNQSQRQAIDDLLKFEDRKNAWQRFKRSFLKLQLLRSWEVNYNLMKTTNKKRIYETCNLGQVTFKDGLPASHRLWHISDDFVEYEIHENKER